MAVVSRCHGRVDGGCSWVGLGSAFQDFPTLLDAYKEKPTLLGLGQLRIRCLCLYVSRSPLLSSIALLFIF